MAKQLSPGDTIGILGGGQLGRMLALAAARLGLKCHIFEPGANCPAAQVAYRCTTANYEDTKALREFAQSVDVVTFEFENVPDDALDQIEDIVQVRPNRRALTTSQDRFLEKEFLTELGLSVAPFAAVSDKATLDQAIEKVGLPAILKTRRFGYDGKGQHRLKTHDDVSIVAQFIHETGFVLEGFLEFETEISVIGARGIDGEIACFDPGENIHVDGILDTTTVPALVTHAISIDAILIAGRILNALDYVGVLGVELFVTKTGLIVNEIAPRVHNSGHWTQNACLVDQFEQHIRAISGWPLADGQRHSDAVMKNLIGSDVNLWRDYPNDAVHLYGKEEIKTGRKMGHVNMLKRKM